MAEVLAVAGTVIQLIGSAISVIDQIINIVQAARHHKANCKEFAAHLLLIRGLLADPELSNL